MKIHVLRADTDGTAERREACAICEAEFALGPVYAVMSTGVGPDYLCERCLSGLCEFARRADLSVEWRDADKVYRDAHALYPEPLSSHEALLAMSAEDQLGVYSEAYLTPY